MKIFEDPRAWALYFLGFVFGSACQEFRELRPWLWIGGAVLFLFLESRWKVIPRRSKLAEALPSAER